MDLKTVGVGTIPHHGMERSNKAINIFLLYLQDNFMHHPVSWKGLAEGSQSVDERLTGRSTRVLVSGCKTIQQVIFGSFDT